MEGLRVYKRGNLHTRSVDSRQISLKASLVETFSGDFLGQVQVALFYLRTKKFFWLSFMDWLLNCCDKMCVYDEHPLASQYSLVDFYNLVQIEIIQDAANTRPD